MDDTPDESVGSEPARPSTDPGPGSSTADGGGPDGTDGAGDDGDADLEALRRQVEEEYDFDDFGPADMARMSVEEWEAAFDPDSWIVGDELLDRVERDLKARIARRDVFASLDRAEEDGAPRIAAWSDEGYAVVYPDGTIEGSGTVLRDVKASVALCSMESYDVETPPEDFELPDPSEVPQGTGEFGNLMIQVVAAVQLLAGLGLTVAWLAGATDTIVAPVAALAFLFVGVFLFALVANARLSDRFRAEEFRNRLRAVDEAGAERPEFLPPMADDDADDGADAPPGNGADDDGRSGDDETDGDAAVRR